MNWIKQNTFLTALAAITLALCGAATYYALDRGAAAKKAMRNFSSASGSLSGLHRAEIYPSVENEQKLGEQVQRVIFETDALKEALVRTYPLPMGGDPGTFGQRVQQAYARLRGEWDAAGLEVPENFFLGFEPYRGKIDAPAAAINELDYQLALAVDLVQAAINNKISKINRLSRIDRVRFEDGAPKPAANRGDNIDDEPPPPPFHSYAMDMEVTGREENVRAMINHIARSNTHFLKIRAVHIVNESKDGPKKEEVRNRLDPVRPAGGGLEELFGGAAPAAPPAGLENLFGGFDEPDQDQPAREVALTPVFPKPGAKDAVEFLGSEKVQARVRFDLLIFEQEPEGSGKDPEDEPEVDPIDQAPDGNVESEDF